MTDKPKCPFCGEELEDDIFYAGRKFYSCANPKCKINDWGGCSEQILQDLIDGKKAQDALKVARNLYQELALAYCELVDDYRTTYGRLKTPEQEAQEYMQEYDEKITSITKQEK